MVHAPRRLRSARVLIGGHIDSVPNGGWLDGCLNVMAGSRCSAASRGGRAAADGAARQLGRRGGRAVRTVALRLERRRRLDARPGRAPAAAPTGTGSPSRTRSRAHGVDLDRATESQAAARARGRLPRAAHRAGAGAGVARPAARHRPRHVRRRAPPDHVDGPGGPRRARRRWTSGRDALAGAARLALVIRGSPPRPGTVPCARAANVVCRPGIVTSVVETAEQLLDQRHLDAAEARATCSTTRWRSRALRRRGEHRGRLGADLVDRADPLRRPADRPRRRGDRRGRGDGAPAAERPAARRRRGRRARGCRP